MFGQAYTLCTQEVQHAFHAVTEINPDALSIAQVLDCERANRAL